MVGKPVPHRHGHVSRDEPGAARAARSRAAGVVNEHADIVRHIVKFGGKATPLSETKEYPPQGGGRIYFSLGGPNGKTGGGQYADFMEYNHKGGTWWGNTSTVDAFVIPITIELFNTQGQSQ